MNEENELINSTLCYIERDGKLLLLYRNKKENDLNEGKWIGVGGKFEPGETAEECLLREVYEETGLKLTKWYLHGIVKFISDKWESEDMYLYSASDFTGTLKNECREGELKWVDKDEVLSLPTWEGDKYFVEPLLRGQKRIDMLVKYQGDKLVEVKDFSEEIRVETSEKLRFPHGFSTRIGGVSEGIYESLNLGMNRRDIKERVIENWNRFLEACNISQKEFVCGEQVHGNNVHIADYNDLRPAYGPGEMNVADGYVTNKPGIPLAIFTADCVPVLLEDYDNCVAGAVHCGWRSTVADIQKETIEKMISLNASLDNIHVAIGPAIDRCCFEVGKEVIDAVELLLGENCADLYDAKSDGKYMLDLRGVVKRRFIQLGVSEQNIELVGECTMCHPDRYFSHRYSKGQRGSLACVIGINA